MCKNGDSVYHESNECHLALLPLWILVCRETIATGETNSQLHGDRLIHSQHAGWRGRRWTNVKSPNQSSRKLRQSERVLIGLTEFAVCAAASDSGAIYTLSGHNATMNIHFSWSIVGFISWSLKRMFSMETILQSPVFGALIGAIITLLCVKLWEKKEAARRDKKRPQEHDERFWFVKTVRWSKHVCNLYERN